MPHATDKAAEAVKLEVPAGQVLLGEELHYIRADGARIPVQMVKIADRLRDEAVRDQIARASEESARMAAFKASAFEEFDTLLDVLASQYEAPMGGKKGNVSFETIDGCMKVLIAVQDRIVFGAELKIAETLVNQLLTEWGEGSRAEIRAIVQNAFQVDKDQQVNRGALLSLMRLNIEDERWKRAMQAIRDSMRIDGSKRYIRFYRRPNVEAAWVAIPLGIAAA